MSDMKLKTIEDWQNSGCRTWDEYCKFGDLVDQEVADYFLNILPPQTMKRGYFQVNLFEITTKIAKTGFECGILPKSPVFMHFSSKLRTV